MPTPNTLATDAAVAVLMAPGLEEVEALAVVDILYRAGIRADLIALDADGAGRPRVVSSHGIDIGCDLLLDDASLADYAMVFLPGGLPGTTILADSPVVADEIRRRGAHGLPVAAICAAPSILADLGLLDGRSATANPAYMTAIADAGATALEDAVVVDGPIITSRGMGTAIDLGLQIVRTLLDEDAVARVADGIVYRG
ncbi:DJ-1/PfpI family protein [Actinomyces sp. B33]|uniref:DJ-1 family glyoxalase III n=1 Tax=Actinomyces sp. B33 TaxID=2942131 RepID=UPI002341E44E|nr:DJ-1 family glyoxalase III [Actinomyces sp. B33]MDC4233752.1 DJ-1/PfpI family protein [Actinomyces sp. B33]